MAITVTDYQPDDTIAIDTYIGSNTPTTNFGTGANILIFDSPVTATLIRFDWIWNSLLNRKIKLISDIELELYANAISNYGDWTAKLYLIKRDWVESEVTWNNWKSGNAWQTAGAQGADDALFTGWTSIIKTVGSTWYSYYIPASVVAQGLANQFFGIMIYGQTAYGYSGGTCQITYSSSSNATASQRPKYTFTYEPYHKIYMAKSGLGQVK